MRPLSAENLFCPADLRCTNEVPWATASCRETTPPTPTPTPGGNLTVMQPTADKYTRLARTSVSLASSRKSWTKIAAQWQMHESSCRQLLKRCETKRHGMGGGSGMMPRLRGLKEGLEIMNQGHEDKLGHLDWLRRSPQCTR